MGDILGVFEVLLCLEFVGFEWVMVKVKGEEDGGLK